MANVYYQTLHLSSAVATATPVGQPVNTTASTTVFGGQVNTVTPASMAGIALGMVLQVYGGAGTSEEITVLSLTNNGTAFTALFANSHSTTYKLTSKRKIQLGDVTFGALGSGMTLTLYNGNPDAGLAAQFANALGYGKISTINASPQPYHFELLCTYGLYVTYTGTTPGDVSIQWLGRTL